MSTYVPGVSPYVYFKWWHKEPPLMNNYYLAIDAYSLVPTKIIYSRVLDAWQKNGFIKPTESGGFVGMKNLGGLVEPDTLMVI